jgi:hypothetical protein
VKRLISKPVSQIVITFTFTFTFPIQDSRAQLFGPRNFEDCVLQGLRDAKTETSARMVPSICDAKFNAGKADTLQTKADQIVEKQCDTDKLQRYAEWIIKNESRKNTGDRAWETVVSAFRELRDYCK